MHIDVNSAFLSWTAAYEKQIGIERDIREVPSIIGGNEQSRHGIVLAKSGPAKKYNIQTGMSLVEARSLCANLVIVHPDYSLYIKASKALRDYLSTYTPDVDVFSIDECFLRFYNLGRDEALDLAYKIKDRVKESFGYTVNIGVSENKLLAKMAGDFEKPDKCHTCFKDEIERKLWPLPVGDLFMVGRRTSAKLINYGINTIGELAKTDFSFLNYKLKSHGRLIYAYAHGIDASEFKPAPLIKSVGNSSTLKFDVEDAETAHAIILSLVELTAIRLREAKMFCRVVSIGIKDKDFGYISRQKKIAYYTDCTTDIYKSACDLFDLHWDKKPIRQLGVSVSDLELTKYEQLSLYKDRTTINSEKLDKVIDRLREKYGNYSVIRGVFANTDLSPVLGGYPSDEYPGMSSIL
jgi:DNA polymerase-4